MFCSKETLLLEPEKSAPRIDTLEPEKVDEEEDGKKDESSCSSEEEDDEDSESETEAGTVCVTYFRLVVVSLNQVKTKEFRLNVSHTNLILPTLFLVVKRHHLNLFSILQLCSDFLKHIFQNCFLLLIVN